MTRLRRSGARTAATLLAFLLTGCGVADTPVIDAGPPAITLPQQRVVYYLDSTSWPTPVQFPPAADGTNALDLLFAPMPANIADRGLSSEVAESEDRVRTVANQEDSSPLTVVLPAGMVLPSPAGRRQIACTVIHDPELNPRDWAGQVILVDDTGEQADATC
ncbi:hypothetical protein QM646_00890 [Rhodococcus erythropolis]|nr:hypothetical protein [Rhodococcus erythropolis]